MRPLVVFVMLVAAAAPAYAQMDSREGIALQNQILELRHELQDMQRSGGGYEPPRPAQQSSGGAGSGELAAALLDRVSRLEDQTRSLRGQVDQLQYQLTAQQRDLSKQIGDLAFRQQTASSASPSTYAPGSPFVPPATLGTEAPAPPAPVSPLPQGALAVPPPPPRRTPELAISEASAALARHDYPAAEAAAREVLARGNSPRAVDAQYILAQSEAALHNSQQAAVDYYDAYNRAPKAARASEALLGVANALLVLNDKKSACQALAKLRAEFPSPRAEIREEATTARRNAGCRG